MPKDLTVILEDHPGTLADMAEALGKAGVNVEGGAAIPSGGKAAVHILVEDAAAARRALQAAKLQVQDERDVLVLPVADKPGELGKIARKLANAGVNINLVYLASNARVVIGVNDLGKARAAL